MVSAALSAALAIVASGVGVGFDWQPMPGDSSASELVVQVDPATLERLSDGAAIPLTADVPPEAGRVARVRVVVGGALAPTRRDLPLARREETRLKPIGEPSTIVLTQYNEPDSRYGAVAPNYGAPPSAAQPLVTTPTPQTFDPYTQAPPTAATASDWNTGAAANNAATNSFQRIGSGIQTAAQPLQDGVERVGDSVRQLGQNIAGRADQLRDSLGRPLQNGLLGGGSATTAATTSDAGAASQWNGAPSLPVTQPPTTPPLSGLPAGLPVGSTSGVAEGAGSNWNGAASTTPGVGGTFGATGAPSVAPPYGSASGTAAAAANADRWANADDPRLRTGAGNPAPPVTGGNFGTPSGLGGQGAAGTQGGFGTTPGGFGNASTSGNMPSGNGGGGSGSTWGGGNTLALPDPPRLTTPSSGQGQSGPLLAPPSGATTGAPEVRGWMLDQASNRGLEGAEATPAAGASLALGSPALGSPALGGAAPGGQAPGGANPSGSMLASPSWATGQQPPATTPAAGLPSSGGSPADGRNQAAVILAWVLLFASVAGNMYLFWSYLDVRTKYRALVRKTARAVGSRLSAA